MQPVKHKIYVLLFINYYCIIDSFWYLLLSDTLSSKTKTFVAILR